MGRSLLTPDFKKWNYMPYAWVKKFNKDKCQFLQNKKEVFCKDNCIRATEEKAQK